ncbi:MAG: ATP-binding protein [Sphingobacteriales bacterium]|nr:ATP-binding protein [Sphingobacteriales bacterium]
MPSGSVFTPQYNKIENERFEALFQFASMGILVANSGGEIVLANDFLITLFGYDNADELVGNKIEKLIPQRYHSGHVHQRDHYMQEPKRRPMGRGIDLFASRKDGSEFPVEISLSNYSTDEGNYAIAFITDISKRKEIENAVMEQKEELASINLKIEELNNDLEKKVELRTKQLRDTMKQLETSRDEITKALSKEKELSDLKSRFVSMASHEFRTPLSTILSSASLVAKYTESEEQDKRDRHIQRIKSSVNNLTDILNEFLSLGKIEDGKIVSHYAEFSIKEMGTAICNELTGIARPGQQLIYTHQGNEIVHLDPTLFRNVIINLLSNAIKFTPENGTITITSKVTPKKISLRIKDNGLGISPEDQSHLFERFFRGANVINIQGTGLGLHIVGKYIELMNGQIEFNSVLEKGTEFIITFNIE